MAKVMFIHGFASCGVGNKSTVLRQWFGTDQVLSPDLPADPDAAIAAADALLQTEDIDLLVGSSLGGYYATWLGSQHGCPAVLINPSIRPYQTLASYIGRQRWWCRDEEFDWTREHLEALHRYRVGQAGAPCLVLLQSDDEVLDYRHARDYYHEQRVIIEMGGNHRFENLEDYQSLIERFRAGKSG
jgi:predicted esterase YcpF (UPF0227 family)